MPDPVGPTSATVVPSRDREVDAVQDLGAVVGEPDVLDVEPARPVERGQPARAVLEAAGRVEHVADAVPADDAARHLAEHPAERPDREREQREQVGDLDEVGRAGRAGLDPEAADQEHGEHAEDGQRLHRRVEQAADAADLHHRVAQLARLGAEPLGLAGLAAERLDDEPAVEALVRDLGDLGAQLLRDGHQRREVALVEQVQHDDRREHDEADERQHEVGEHERDRGDDAA